MHFVGLDLAWGERKPTGVAVLDDDGRLVDIATAARRLQHPRRSSAPTSTGDCLVAIDAPLVVTNPTGQRRRETD